MPTMYASHACAPEVKDGTTAGAGVQVERLDDPSLVGLPLAVRQFNSGGFVAVSYEARAAGVQ
jgi:hypothetical protein